MAGGQLGHPGQTLPLVATPDAVVTHHPTACLRCQTSLEETASHAMERRRVLELPPVRLPVQEHQEAHVRCPYYGRVAIAGFPAAVPSRI